jgi:hypothetical protein
VDVGNFLGMSEQLYAIVKNGRVVPETIRNSRNKSISAMVAIEGYSTILETHPERKVWLESRGYAIQRGVFTLCG